MAESKSQATHRPNNYMHTGGKNGNFEPKGKPRQVDEKQGGSELEEKERNDNGSSLAAGGSSRCGLGPYPIGAGFGVGLQPHRCLIGTWQSANINFFVIVLPVAEVWRFTGMTSRIVTLPRYTRFSIVTHWISLM